MSASSGMDVADVRPGEELDAQKLNAYLSEALGVAGPFKVAQFPHGHSNLTYLVSAPSGERFVLRRPPLGVKAGPAHDMTREWRVLSGLDGHFPKIPRPVHLCTDEAVLGAPFYLTEVLTGRIYRKKLPPDAVVDAGAARALCNSLVDTLAELHALDTEQTALSDLGKPAGYVDRQVTGWTGRYEKAATDDIASMSRALTWLADNRPKTSGMALLHNDYKFDNVVYAPSTEGVNTEIIGILDWEMSTRGDPLMDLGTVLSYWVEQGDPAPMQQARFGPTHLPGALTRREVVARYAEKTGETADALTTRMLFYYVFGLVKTAVVTQQIYARFAAGMTKDPRFGAMLGMTKLLAGRAADAVERQQLT